MNNIQVELKIKDSVIYVINLKPFARRKDD